MPLGRHPKKEVQEALERVLAGGWWDLRASGHWSVLYCNKGERDGCRIGVSGTPQDPGTHARRIERIAMKCPHWAGRKEGSSDE